MMQFLIRKFILNYKDVNDASVRIQYGKFSGAVGIICNILLFLIKLLAGVLTSSIGIMADAFNNLSDAGSSIVTLVGFKLADAPPDDEHPYGHGRMEYITGFIVAIVILLVGIEILKTSVTKIFNPETVVLEPLSLCIMIFSIALKLWMFYFNKKIGRSIQSSALLATAKDSLSDVVATSAVVIGMIIQHFVPLQIDGYTGCIVSFFILYTGFSAAKDTIDPLLGSAPDPSFIQEIKQKVLTHPEIVGVHDCMVHNYGPGRIMISLHAEIPANSTVLEAHEAIDAIERELNACFRCQTVIHMDPVIPDDGLSRTLKDEVITIIHGIHEQLSIHDFRVVEDPTCTNIIFDLAVPFHFELTDDALLTEIKEKLQAYDANCQAVICIDRGYCG